MIVEGRRVVITGGSRGIGAALAREFAGAGADVVVVARPSADLDEVAAEVGGRALAADLTDPDQVDRLVDRCREVLGEIDVFVNNAGVETTDAFGHLAVDELRTVARLNFEAPLLLTRAVLPSMLERGDGHIVNVSSLAGAIAWPGLAAYCGTKAGVTNFTETLRMELARSGIGLTVVAPGPVATEMWARLESGRGSYVAPALERFRQMRFLPKLDPAGVAVQIVDAVQDDKPHVRPARRFGAYHVLNNLPRRMVQVALTGVRLDPVRASRSRPAPSPIWPTDSPPSRDWPLYTRGNVGEVFPDVVLPISWDLLGAAAESGWRKAFLQLGLLNSRDIAADEDMALLGVFGGYCYINASLVRLLGVRAPGGSVDVVDEQFFGESEAPAYVERPGDVNRVASARLARTVLRLLAAREVAGLDDDRTDAEAYVAREPPVDAPDTDLLGYIADLRDVFEPLFQRHIHTTFSGALLTGALVDLLTDVDAQDELVSLLAGVGGVESAGPAAAMWDLARVAREEAAVARHFDEGPVGLAERLASDDEVPQRWIESFARFLDAHGCRGPNEWDIGSDPWEMRPDLALVAIDRMRHAADSRDPTAAEARLSASRRRVTDDVRRRFGRVDRVRFDRVLAAAIRTTRARETTKTTVVTAIGAARRAHTELARRVARRGGPATRLDISMLELDELASCLESPEAWGAVIEERRALHDRLSGLEPPFIVDGDVPPLDAWSPRRMDAVQLGAGDALTGIAGCPGVARGRARVVMAPDEAGDLATDDILVAPITDPSWTPLFLAAAGVVVDTGALMSHAVIVSRELGIPCVVSAVGATGAIPDGAVIEVDGGRGTVRVLEVD